MAAALSADVRPIARLGATAEMLMERLRRRVSDSLRDWESAGAVLILRVNSSAGFLLIL
jgi:hypothetical protein